MGMSSLVSRPRRKFAARVVACGVAGILAAGCGGHGSGPTPRAVGGPSATTSAAGSSGGVTPKYPAWTQPIPQFSPKNRAKDLDQWTEPMAAAAARGLAVWIEVDLVTPWLSGPADFTTAVSKLAAEAQTPGVVGFKIADELGQPGQGSTTSPEQALAFLHDARAALHAAAPGKLVLIDVIGADLGCVPGSTSSAAKKCLSANAPTDASMSLDTIDKIVDSGYVDELDVTTNMADPAKYLQEFGVSLADAQRKAFAEIKRRHWDTKVVVNTRKAFSWPTEKIATPDVAANLVSDFIDVPIAAGAKAVDTWAFVQFYARTKATVSQMSPGNRSNALWEKFKTEKAQHVDLFTHYTPTYKMGTLQQDMDDIAQAFTGVFCAAGVR